jgi:hypothetical protein
VDYERKIGVGCPPPVDTGSKLPYYRGFVIIIEAWEFTFKHPHSNNRGKESSPRTKLGFHNPVP